MADESAAATAAVSDDTVKVTSDEHGSTAADPAHVAVEATTASDAAGAAAEGSGARMRRKTATKAPKGVRPTRDTLYKSSAKARLGVMICFLSVAIDMLGVSVILPVLPFLAIEFGGAGVETGIIFAAYALAQAVSTPVAGKLADRFGRRRLILASMLGSCIGFLLQGFSQSFIGFLLARCAAGAVGSSVPVAQAYVADVTSVAERARLLAGLGSVIGVSFAFGPSIGAGLSTFGLRVPMFVSSGIAFVGFCAALTQLPDSMAMKAEFDAAAAKEDAEAEARTPSLRTTSMDAPGRSMSVDEPASSGKQGAEQAVPPGTFKSLVRLMWLAEFFNTASFMSFFSMVGIYVESKFSFGSVEAGFIVTSFAVAFILGQVTLWNRVHPRIGKHVSLAVGAGLFGVGSLLAPQAENIGAMVPFLLLMALGYSLQTPAIATLTSRYAEDGHQGQTMGTALTFQALSRVVGPPLFGIAFNELGIAAPFYIGSCLCFITVLLALYSLQRNKAIKSGLRTTRSDVNLLRDVEAGGAAALVAATAVAGDDELPADVATRLGEVTAKLLAGLGLSPEVLATPEGMAEAESLLEVALRARDDDDEPKARIPGEDADEETETLEVLGSHVKMR